MNKAAAKMTTTSTPSKSSVIEKKAPTAVFGAALIDIGWKLAILIIVPLWYVSTSQKTWMSRPLFGILFLVWVVVVFSSIVYAALRKVPRDMGGLQK